jgi:glycolate oxidase FAD binding subunit
MMVADIAGSLSAAPNVEVLADPVPDGYEVDGCRPHALVRPRDEAGVSAVLRLASKHRLRVVPRGGGTANDLGNKPTGVDLVLDLTLLDRVIEYRPRDLTVTVEAGITLATLQRALDGHHQIVALDPPLPERATVGGTLAANLTGPRRFRYGTARDLVIGSAASLPDGTGIKSGGRVVKNVAGYDLNKLLVGSSGTLAVITRATVKLLPAPPERAVVIAAFETLPAAHAGAMRVAGSALGVLTVDLVNPYASRRLAGSLPPGIGEGWLLITEIGATAAGTTRTRGDLIAVARDAGCRDVVDADVSAADRVAVALRDYGRSADGRASVILRAAVLPSQVARAVSLIEDVAGKAEHKVSVVARAGNGIVYSFWPDMTGTQLRSLVARLRKGLVALDGLLVVERCPAEAKDGLDVWGIAGPDVDLMRRVKREFDPDAILSPGRGPGGL